MDLADSNLFYRQPALYDQTRGDDTTIADLSADLLATHGPADPPSILDLGCGTGRELAQLAERFTCVGVDVQPQLVTYARQTHPTLDTRVGDVRTFRLGHTADLILCVGNVLAYLHDNDDLQAAFATFTAHAHPGTVLVLYLPVAPSLPAVTNAPPRTSRVPDLDAEITISYTWDPRGQIETMHRHWHFDNGHQAHDRIARRIIGPRELGTYLTTAGFEVLELFDDPSHRQRQLRGPGAYIIARFLPNG